MSPRHLNAGNTTGRGPLAGEDAISEIDLLGQGVATADISDSTRTRYRCHQLASVR